MYGFVLATALSLGSPSLASAGTPQSSPATSAIQVMQADTPRTLPHGTRFVVPRGWSVREAGSAIILGAPERDSHIAIVDAPGSDAEAAVAAAWAAYRPGFTLTANAFDRPARNGWDQIRLYRYEGAADTQRTLSVQARRKDAHWTVAIYDMSDAVAEKRDSQLELIYNTLLPRGYERESFAGRPAHRLDAGRITALTQFIEAARAEFDIPGIALGLIQDGEVLFEGGFGVRELGSPAPVDADTLFMIASNTKALTTLMLAKLVEAGRFDWETPVTRLWPDFRLGDEETSRRVLVRHLVCACTGLPRQDLEWIFEGHQGTPASFMRLLFATHPTSEIGELYQYSNLLAASAGFLGGRVLYPGRELGSAYDAAMQDLVLDPLGMRSTTFDYGLALEGNHASPHGQDVEGNVVVADMDINYSDLPVRPDGGAWSNVRDMLRYIRMELARGVLPDGRRYIHEDVLLARSQPQVTEGRDEYYGIGLKIDRQWAVPVIHHGGTAFGYRSDMYWLPEHGVGAVLLTNSDTGGSVRSAFRRRLLEVLFDGAPEAASNLASFAQQSRDGIAARRQRLTVPADPAIASGLAARYRSSELGNLTVRREGGTTWFDFGGWSSEVATQRDGDGAVSFVTVSPTTDGFEFAVAEENDERRLIIRDSNREYVFTEVE